VRRSWWWVVTGGWCWPARNVVVIDHTRRTDNHDRPPVPACLSACLPLHLPLHTLPTLGVARGAEAHPRCCCFPPSPRTGHGMVAPQHRISGLARGRIWPRASAKPDRASLGKFRRPFRRDVSELPTIDLVEGLAFLRGRGRSTSNIDIIISIIVILVHRTPPYQLPPQFPSKWEPAAHRKGQLSTGPSGPEMRLSP